jgi:hypothetical protein
MIFPLNSSHREICRFADSCSQEYLLVEGAIKEITSGQSTKDGTGTRAFQMSYLMHTDTQSFSFSRLTHVVIFRRKLAQRCQTSVA